MGIPATEREWIIDCIDIVRMATDGLAAEHWGVFDTMGVMMQLGVIEQPAPADSPTG
jgi:hypothetical protein